MQKKGFDNQKYLSAQTKNILARVEKFKGKLYLEFGGKLCYDYHAARVLPGYDPNVKVELLKELGDKKEIIFCVSARAIQEGKVRGDFGLTYDNVTLKTIEDFDSMGLSISAVIINLFSGEKKAVTFQKHLEKLGVRVFTSPLIDGYPFDIEKAVSKEGFGLTPFIETSKPIIIVTGAGPNSGKMATALGQVWHHYNKGKEAGYAKFETFPIWNLPLKHPVNVAYESATADLGDFNLVDPFHLARYNITSINYNRDVENFGILKRMIDKIAKKGDALSMYNSPTDMGVNMAKEGIVDDAVVAEAAKQEIVSRWFKYNKEYTMGTGSRETLERSEKIINEMGCKLTDRKVVMPAREAAESAKNKSEGNKGVFCGAALELPQGEIIKAHNSPLIHAESAIILKAVKKLAGIPEEIHLLAPSVLNNIGALKGEVSGIDSPSLNLDETLIALSVSSGTNTLAEAGLKKLKQLGGCEMHLTHLPTPGDEVGLRKLRINYTTDAHLTLQNYIGI